ncbi:MAG: HAD hydrolase-like protein [Sphaerospermopsis kisseleviana]
MNRILFVDLDGTVRRTKSGATFINDPYDQEIIPGVQEAIARYHDWKIIGITNQGGVGAGHKTLKDCVLEQQYTLKLLPNLSYIFFCPDNGQTTYQVWEKRYQKIDPFEKLNFRKPGTGMIDWAIRCNSQTKQYLMIGDRPEDQQCADNANIPFMWAEDWRNG